jgi:hypothetical protein
LTTAGYHDLTTFGRSYDTPGYSNRTGNNIPFLNIIPSMALYISIRLAGRDAQPSGDIQQQMFSG